MRKETVTKADLFAVLTLLEDAAIPYWLDGGWGVDVLTGRETRPHRDIDINFDARYTDALLSLLAGNGYRKDTDWMPVRLELYSDALGYLDVHPIEFRPDGSARQADRGGGWYEFAADYFGSTIFGGRKIPCITAKGQLAFHTGYTPRDKDLHDLALIRQLL